MNQKDTILVSIFMTFVISLSIVTTGFVPIFEENDLMMNVDADFTSIEQISSQMALNNDFEITVNKTVRSGTSGPWFDDITVNIGENVQFNLTVTNTGNYGLTMNRIFDYLPGGLVYISGSSHFYPPSGLSYPKEPSSILNQAGSKLITWGNLGCFDVGETFTLIFSATTTDCGVFENIGCANATYPVDPEDCDNAIVRVIGCDEDLELTVDKLVKWDCCGMFDDEISFDINDYDWVTFKLLVDCVDDFDSLVVKDVLPVGLSYVSGYATVNGVGDEPEVSGQVLWWNFTGVSAGDSFEILFRASVDDCGDFRNVVYVDGESCYGDASDSEDAWVHVTGCESDISVDKKVSIDGCNWQDEHIDVKVGDTVYFKINVSNDGSYDLSGVRVVDYLPTMLSYNGDANPALSQFVPLNQLEWFFPYIYTGNYKIITYSAEVVEIGDAFNIVNVTACGGTPSDEDEVEISASGGMGVNKRASIDGNNWFENVTVDLGGRVHFNITLSYYGSYYLFDIHVKDTLPNGVTYIAGSTNITGDISVTNEEPVKVGNKLYWNFTHPEAFLSDGEHIYIEFEALVTTRGDHTNLVTVIAQECSETTLTDQDTAHAFVSAGVDVECEKTALDPTGKWVNEVDAEVGDIVRFNISLVNTGYQPLYGIDMIDTLPSSDLKYVIGSARLHFQGDIYEVEPTIHSENNTLLWNNLNFYTGEYLEHGQCISIIFNVKVLDTGRLINHADITACMCSSCTPIKCSDEAIIDASETVDDLKADAGGPYSAFVGGAVSFSGSATGGIEPYTFLWDMDNDGEYDDATGKTPSRSWSNPGTYTVKLLVIDDRDEEDTDTVQVTIQEQSIDPDLLCQGSLSWTEVKPGQTVTGTFSLRNVGDAGSELDWEITSYPTWGTWSFSPYNGFNLRPEDGTVTIQVTVTAPDEKEQGFSGQVRITNRENTGDFATISVSLATPHSIGNPFAVFLLWIVDHFPRLEPFIYTFFSDLLPN